MYLKKSPLTSSNEGMWRKEIFSSFRPNVLSDTKIMCGIAGIYSMDGGRRVDESILSAMTEALSHRGPDDSSHFSYDNLALGFKRLSIIDVKYGNQPFFSPDKSVVSICNGEIFNFKELRKDLLQKNYPFRSNCDVEVIPMLYQEYGIDFVNKLNGQFAIALYDFNKCQLILVRDHFGICPLFYTIVDGQLIFASEIKALLKYPNLSRGVDLTGLDQILSFPGLVSPNTMFHGIRSVRPGYSLRVNSHIQHLKYWDLDYPKADEIGYVEKTEQQYIDETEERLLESIQYRMRSDVTVGYYLSGGLDSSLIGSMTNKFANGKKLASLSIYFPGQENKDLNEQAHQCFVAGYLGSENFSIPFDIDRIQKSMHDAIWFSECPLKETYNTCSMALSEQARRNEIKVILSGEGADESFGGYVGYRFDKFRQNMPAHLNVEDYFEREIRQHLWGDPDFFYEKNQYEFKNVKAGIFSPGVNELFPDFDCLKSLPIERDMLAGRDSFHKRSYLDFKLRLGDHLLADHCDRMSYANSVEGRFPFLDINLIEYLRSVPSSVKIKGNQEKYLLKRIAGQYLPSRIINREKFGFIAPGSPQLLQSKVDWVHDILSYDYIKKRGYFNPDVIERIKAKYQTPGFNLSFPFESDLLIVVITFHLFLETFKMPSL